MTNAVNWLLGLFYLDKPKEKTPNESPTVKKASSTKKVAKIKATAKKKNVIKNYVGRKPKSKK